MADLTLIIDNIFKIDNLLGSYDSNSPSYSPSLCYLLPHLAIPFGKPPKTFSNLLLLYLANSSINNGNFTIEAYKSVEQQVVASESTISYGIPG